MSGDHYVLRVHFSGGRGARDFSFAAPRIKIGRDAGEIVLGDPQASAVHCEVEFAGGLVTVRDLGSSNGTWFRDQRQSQFSLSEGQSFRAGHTVIELVSVVSQFKVASGRTVISEGHDLQAMLAGAQVQAGARQPSAPARQGVVAPAPTTAPAPSSARKGGVGALVAGVVGLLVLGGAGGAAYWFLLGPGSTQLAAADDAKPPEGEGTGGEVDGGAGTTPQPLDPDTLAGTGGAELVEAGEPEDKDLGQIYREVGAATVVVRAPGSVGSGAIIDPSGIILTNHHVIDGGKKEDLKMKVTVVFGDYDEELRAYEPNPEHHDAHVIAIDEDHDLAMIRLDDPPEDLPVLAIADEPPYPGQEVAAIGHAGAGMLWAIKGGEVSATGSLTGHTDLQVQAREIDDEETIERLRSVWVRKGRTVQSTAKILPGDSGGPLVNMQGELVGVNAFGKLDERTNQWLSFHVHHEEVVRFTAERPERPMDVFPDPYTFGLDGDVALEDRDFDGKAEALLLSNRWVRPGRAVLLDLDQDGGHAPVPGDDYGEEAALQALVEKRGFDAEFAVVVEKSGRHHYWYDRDADGDYDLYVVDDTGRGTNLTSYQLSPDAPARKLSNSAVTRPFDAAPFGSPELAGRFNAVIPTIFDDVEPSGAAGRPALFGAAKSRFSLKDYDGDGTDETVEQRDARHARALWDVDQSAVAELDGAGVGAALTNNELDAEAGAVVQGNNAWVWYDTDDDGRMDLVLYARDRAAGVTTSAHRLDGDEASGDATAGTPAPEWVGQRLVRGDLLPPTSRDAGGPRLARAGKELLDTNAVTAVEGGPLRAFPGGKLTSFAHIQMHALAGHDNRMAEVTDRGFDILAFDLDGDSFAGAADAAQAATAVKQGAFDAEVAIITHADLTWTFWDGDGDGAFDLVRFDALGTQKASHAFRVSGDGVARDAAEEGADMFAAGILGDAALEKAFAAALKVSEKL